MWPFVYIGIHRRFIYKGEDGVSKIFTGNTWRLVDRSIDNIVVYPAAEEVGEAAAAAMREAEARF